MTFVFPLLLGSLVLLGIPVLIHLIMRQKPITLPFPAFRFLLQKHRTNLRKLRLRHFLLLALRLLLIAGIALALARPKLFYQGMNLSSDRPVAAVLIFDTSFSMEYKTSDEISRLEEAKKRGLELLDQLPDESRVVILDSADAVAGKASWLRAPAQAREKIAALKLKPANAPVSQRLEDAFRLLAQLARDQDDETAHRLPRLVFVFSDRTRAAWDAARIGPLCQSGDQVPPSFLGLQQARAELPNVVDLLGDLRKQLPPSPGKDYPEQFLLTGLGQLKEKLASLRPEDLPPDTELAKLFDSVRRGIRELADILQSSKEKISDAAKEYRDRLLAGLNALRRDLAGFQGFFVDVGVDQPADVALLDLAFPVGNDGHPREIFGQDENWVLRALVQCTGKDVSTMLRLQVGSKNFQKALDIKAGERQTIPFEVNCRELSLTPGRHSLEMAIETRDLLPINNSRFATFAIREPRKILVLADQPKKADDFAFALQLVGFAPHVQTPEAFLPAANFLPYQGVYLFSLQEPSPTLWTALEDYVHRGGSVAVIPPGQELNQAAYSQETALKLLPGTFKNVVTHKEGITWDWQDSIYRYPLLESFREASKNPDTDFILLPRLALKYWEVVPKARAMVLVRYADEQNRPALLERLVQEKKGTMGKVLLLTTPLDARDPPWNNYAQNLTVFYPYLIDRCTNYLTGELEIATMNFVTGQGDPMVSLPLAPRYRAYLLQGPELFETISLAEGVKNLVLKQAVGPGNFTVKGMPVEESKFMSRFSVNLPLEESDLTRVPVPEIDAVLGPDSVLPAKRQAGIHDILQGHWNEPLELFSPLMVLILLILAVENLLANKFYRKDQVPVQ